MERIEIFGRVVYPITSQEGQKDYFDHLNHWHVCYQNSNTLISPTRYEALEYISLQTEQDKLYFCNDKESRRKRRQLEIYKTRYDWRPRKSGDGKFGGLISPTGKQLMPNYFADIFTQFDALRALPEFIPVSDGHAWALASISDPPVMMTDFQYNAIIPASLILIQDIDTLKWGAMGLSYTSLNTKCMFRNQLPLLKLVMPLVADEIYEDELITEAEPTIFFMTRIDDKIGILTPFGYSPIKYDTYQTDNDKCSFRLIRHDRKKAHRADYWHPEGKFRSDGLQYRKLLKFNR